MSSVNSHAVNHVWRSPSPQEGSPLANFLVWHFEQLRGNRPAGPHMLAAWDASTSKFVRNTVRNYASIPNSIGLRISRMMSRQKCRAQAAGSGMFSVLRMNYGAECGELPCAFPALTRALAAAVRENAPSNSLATLQRARRAAPKPHLRRGRTSKCRVE